MKNYILFAGLLIIIFSSCEKKKIEFDPEYLLIGTWSFNDYQDNSTIYQRSKELNDNYPGYIFLSDGSLIERKNAGWCGTPPVSYSNYDGKWSIINDTLIEVNVGYWGGTIRYKLDIESITNTSLKLTYIQWEK